MGRSNLVAMVGDLWKSDLFQIRVVYPACSNICQTLSGEFSSAVGDKKKRESKKELEGLFNGLMQRPFRRELVG
jgi:hypothetical protein